MRASASSRDDSGSCRSLKKYLDNMFKTFVINLDKDKERMDFMSQQLVNCEIPYHRQSAVYGKDYRASYVEYDEAGAIAKTGHALLPGELGCALSHAKVYEQIVREEIPFSLILEDDVELPSNFKHIVNRMITEQGKTNFEYLLFDYVPVGLPFLKQWFRSVRVRVNNEFQYSLPRATLTALYAIFKIPYIVPLAIFEGCRDGVMYETGGPVRFLRPVYFAGAYLLTLQGAKKLHSLTKPILYTADQLPNRARIINKLRFFCYAPLSVKQLKTTFGSSILDVAGKDIECGYE